MGVKVIHADCLEAMAAMAAEGRTVQAIVTDPPYHLVSIVKRFGKEGSAPPVAKHGQYGSKAMKGFMGKKWDGGDVAFRPETWRLAFDLLPPGGWLVAFSGTRTYHRMACAVEDAGFEIRDMLSWLYGSGMPKNLNLAKAIDKRLGTPGKVVPAGNEKRRMPTGTQATGTGSWSTQDRTYQPGEYVPGSDEAAAWDGWGTALKPACEPIVLARKPVDKTTVGTVLEHGAGALNIRATSIAAEKPTGWSGNAAGGRTWNDSNMGLGKDGEARPADARWPANVVHDGSADVAGVFDRYGEKTSGSGTVKRASGADANGNRGAAYGAENRPAGAAQVFYGDTGSPARFFYSAKASAADRLDSEHPTVKPIDLMAWLVRLVTPPGGTVLDPFAGSGTTGMACMREGYDAVLIEREAEYVADIHKRLAHVHGDDLPLFAPEAQRDIFEEQGE